MFLRLLASLVVGVALSHAARMPSREDQNRTKLSHLAKVSNNQPWGGGGSTDKDAPRQSVSILGELDKQISAISVGEVLIHAMEGLAHMDWSGDVGAQLGSIALSVVHTTLSMINPLLGIGFSLLSSIFGWGGHDDSTQKFVDAILEEVDVRINSAFADFQRKLVANYLDKLFTDVQWAETLDDWLDIQKEFHLPTVFNSSCTNGDDETCRVFQVKDGGKHALLTEIHFTELMAESAAELLRLGAGQGSLRTLGNVVDAGPLLQTHLTRLRAASGINSGRTTVEDTSCIRARLAENRKCTCTIKVHQAKWASSGGYLTGDNCDKNGATSKEGYRGDKECPVHAVNQRLTLCKAGNQQRTEKAWDSFQNQVTAIRKVENTFKPWLR